MIGRVVAHRLFAPVLVLAIFGLGAVTVAFLLVGPGLGQWTDTLLVACFGWNGETRRYRLDALILTLLQPPFYASIVFAFYRDELRAFLASRAGIITLTLAPSVFATLAVSLLATSQISASGAIPNPRQPVSPIRQGSRAPAFSFVDHRGELVSLEHLAGRAVVMTFVYANCHSTCPALVSRLKALDARTPNASVAFVAVSLDPERDTPATLGVAADQWQLGSRWHLLTGEPLAVRKLIAAYRIQWAPLPDGEIAHENVVILIDGRGRLAFTYRGLAHPEERQLADLTRLAGERG